MSGKEILIAYLAGVIDSDGTIGIKKSTYAMRVRGDAGQPIYSERVAVKQVEPQAIALLHQTFSGYRCIERPSAKRGRPLHCWQVHSLAAGKALTDLYPFLRIKKRQAANALKLRSLIGQGRHWLVPAIKRDEAMVTATEFAKLAGAIPQTVLQAARLGSIPSMRKGQSRLIPLSYLDQYLARRRWGGHAPRQNAVSQEMEQLFIRAKLLNRVGS